MDTVLHTIEGVFSRHNGEVVVQTSPGTVVQLAELLRGVVGRQVDVVAHYLLPEPPLPEQPGFGCCVSPSSCALHSSGSALPLFSFEAHGTLAQIDGSWLVGGQVFSLQNLPGHRARVVLFAPPATTSPDNDLAQEAQQLVDLLTGLRAAVVDNTE